MKTQMDYIDIDRIVPCSAGPDSSEFEAKTIASVKEEGFYNPITTHVRLKGYKFDPNAHYISLGHHRYWMAIEAGLTHLWCLSKVWNTLMVGDEEPGAWDKIEMMPLIRAKKEPPWDIRDLEIVPNPEGYYSIQARAYQERAEGQFTGRLLIQPNQKVNLSYVLKISMMNQTRDIVE